MTVASPPTGVSNADLIRWSFEQLNRHEARAMRQLWREDTLQRFPDRTGRGADEIAAYFEETFAALPDLRFVVFDQMQWARQVGLLPADASAADRTLKAAFNARTKLAARLQARRSTS